MKVNALVIDEKAIPLLSSSLSVTEEWFEQFKTVDRQNRISSTIIDGVAVIKSELATSSSRLLIINLGDKNIFKRFGDGHKREVLRRIYVAALSIFTKHVVLPRSWGCFTSSSRISFHALPIASRGAAQEADTRIEVDRSPFGSQHAYVYGFPVGFHNLPQSKPSKEVFDRACGAFKTSLEPGHQFEQAASPDGGAIQLSDESFFHHENTTGLEDWYQYRLTVRQREFVDAPIESPVRLRGAAGTGKTLALAVKLLKSAKERLDAGVPTRYLFLTHSSATSEAIASLIASLDNEGIAERMHSTPGYALEISTLLDLAWGAVGSEMENDGVLPLSSDALEGRQLQLELIESIVARYITSNDWKVMKVLVSSDFLEMMAAPLGTPGFKRLVWELMNEFACVLDADGVQYKAGLRKQYLSMGRQAWMMPLVGEVDRKIVLELYDLFNREIREMSAISVDQVISDFLNYLESFRWNAIRVNRGYDVVFVDELHLFNRQERMVVHGLMRSPHGPPSIFMAYDAKQAPSDTFMPSEDRESNSAFWERLKVGQIQKVELDQVFRYTPEIAKFVASLDQTFPALDLGDEWGVYNISSSVASSQVPTLVILDDEKEMYTKVMLRARTLKRRGGEKYSVAVLCCNLDRLETFRSASAHKKDFNAITSREDAGIAKPDAFRFVLSTPEYVAGLQFDCVMLLDVNKSEIPEGPYSTGARRKFISIVYLGSSRAKVQLELYSTASEGGPPGILDNALANGALRVVEWSKL